MNEKITKANESILRFSIRVELLEYSQLCKMRENYLGRRNTSTYKNLTQRMVVKEQEILNAINTLMKFYGYRNKAIGIQWFKSVGCKVLYKDQDKARTNWLVQHLENHTSSTKGGY